MKSAKMPILAHGELYIEGIEKRGSYGDKSYPRDYESARDMVLSDIEVLKSDIIEENQYCLDEQVICVRLEPKFEAKSYFPDAIAAASKHMKIIGGRRYSFDKGQNHAKLYFVRTDSTGLDDIYRKLKTENVTSKKWQDQIRSLKTINLADPLEKINGFPETWKSGHVEFVLHPMGEKCIDASLNRFFSIAEIERSKAEVRIYEDGLTFISAKADLDIIHRIAKYNPLRNVHPVFECEDDILRSIPTKGPKPASGRVRSDVVVATFDGGLDEENPYLKGYAKNVDCVDTDKTSLKHGTAVAGALLYGHIKDPMALNELETPDFSVEMFRVYPEKNDYHGDAFAKYGLYETIDTIEKTVKSRRDLKLFNLSSGPKTPILDDDITRFTYVLVELSYNVEDDELNPLFTVAVGNDGHNEKPLNRIQPPADMVNGLSVGAYTYNSLNDKVRAVYSCIGPGREGAKVKPDILEFGGSIDRQFITVSPVYGCLELAAGTSYAAPYAMHKIGKLMAESKSIAPHMGRTLMIHSARLEGRRGHNDESGYGFAAESTDEMLHCDDHEVTILYEGSLLAGSTAKLPIFAPKINKVSGRISIVWTITTIVSPDSNDTDAYTNNCIEDTLYPHSQKYTFSKGSKKIVLDLSKPENVEQQQLFLEQGYTQSLFPVS